jgi:protein-disulfide isomerase
MFTRKLRPDSARGPGSGPRRFLEVSSFAAAILAPKVARLIRRTAAAGNDDTSRMASRKEQKEQARARRLAEEQALSARTSRQRRLQMLGGIIVGVVAILAVAIAISSGGGNTATGLQNGTKASKTYATVSQLLSGIPQTGTTLGNPKAPVTIDYFGDLECPICQEFTLGASGGGFPQLVANDVKQGKVKVVYKSFCTATCNGPGQSVFNSQQVAAYAAGKQNLFWDYTELFYREQGAEGSGYVTPAYLSGLAAQIPTLKQSTWSTDRGDQSLLAQVQADEAAATSQGISGTPTLVARGSKGATLVGGSGIPSYSDIQTAIKQVT